MSFLHLNIQDKLPSGYRLATVDDVLQHRYDEIKLGIPTDVQDIGAERYFSSDKEDVQASDYKKMRLKNGFVDTSRKLAWKAFAALKVVEKLAIVDRGATREKLSEDDLVVALLYACLAEGIEEAKELISEGGIQIIRRAVKNAPCQGNAVHLSAWKGNVKCLQVLLNSDKEAGSTVAELDGETPLLLAARNGHVAAVKLLLSFSEHDINVQTSYFKSTPLMMAAEFHPHLPELCDELLKVEHIRIDLVDAHRNTALHYAAIHTPTDNIYLGSTMELLIKHCGCQLPVEFLGGPLGQEHLDPQSLAKAGESHRMNRAALDALDDKNAHESKRAFLNMKNKRNETPLHMALSHDKVCAIELPRLLICAGADIWMKDFDGRTALHRACSLPCRKGIVRILRSCFTSKTEWSRYTLVEDIAGQTALHVAAFAGHKEAVSLLLDPKFHKELRDLVHARDYNDNTTLHCATKSQGKSKVKLQIVQRILRAAGDDEPERHLLLWAIAEDGHMVDQCVEVPKLDDVNRSQDAKLEEYEWAKSLKAYLRQERLKGTKERNVNLLGIALSLQRHDMIIELINRGANVDDEELKGNKHLRTLLEQHRGRTTDQPTGEDLLEREAIRDAIAALLLNQHMGSPITIGILGGPGMGKSSLMIQVQQVMLKKSALQSILEPDPTNQLEENNFPGAFNLDARSNKRAKGLRHQVVQLKRKVETKQNLIQRYQRQTTAGENFIQKVAMYADEKWKENLGFLYESRHKRNEDEKIAVEMFLKDYRQEESWIWERLALENSGNKAMPAIVTVWYDAWKYETKDEAWAGLAVEILRKMEGFMTAAQILRASFMYAYERTPRDMFFKLALPMIMTILVGLLVAWGSWKLFSLLMTYNVVFRFLRIGAQPLSFLTVLWILAKKYYSVVQLVSEKLRSYTQLPAHESKLGYQHAVIADIKFLRKHMCTKPMLILTMLAWILAPWAPVPSTLADATAVSTEALKCVPSEHNLRVIVFIDNLDRQKEELFAPLNVILKSCDINAVVSIDQKMIDDVIQKEVDIDKVANTTKDTGRMLNTVQDALEATSSSASDKQKFVRQLIQIPIVLPDPGVDELKKKFLKELLNDHSQYHVDYKWQTLELNQGNIEVGKSWPEEVEQINDDMECNLESVMTHYINIPEEGGPSTNRQEEEWRARYKSALDSNYSRGEIEVFQHLVAHTFGEFRSPRQWKSLLNYHRLVRGIMTPQVRRTTSKGWKTQLIVWVFVCWQWREQIDDIIENWSELVKVPKDLELLLKKQGGLRLLSHSAISEASKKILEQSQTQPELFKRKLTDRTTDSLELWEWVNGQYPSLRGIVKERIAQLDKMFTRARDVGDAARKKAQWARMKNALTIGEYDVKMQAIQDFQPFRFDCKFGFLELPCQVDSQD